MYVNNKKSLLYSCGSFAAGLPAAAFSTFIIFFYVDVLKMPSDLIGIGMGIYGIWNAINDPLFGQLSDRTRTKWGRRIPYVKFGSLPFILAFILIWIPPVNYMHGNIKLLFAYFMGAIFLYDGLYTLVILNWTALYPEMYTSQEDRTKVSAYRNILGIIGTIIGSALPPILYDSIGWGAMGILFAVLTLIALYLSLLGSKENPVYSEKESQPLLKSIKSTIKNKSFLTFVLGNMFIQFTFVILQAGMPFYAKYVLKVDGIMVSLLLGIIFIIAIFALYPWTKIANRRGSKKSIVTSIVIFAISILPFWFAKNFVTGLIIAALVGIGLGGIQLLIDVLISDVIDEDEAKTGTRREGSYFGLNALFIRLAISVQSITMGYVLKFSKYDANLGVGNQPQSAINGIKMLITVIPLVALICAGICFAMYPLYGEKLKEVKGKVLKMHSENTNISM
jgi:GPH family glycoside/pentoside/hexuronide:cation symporter